MRSELSELSVLDRRDPTNAAATGTATAAAHYGRQRERRQMGWRDTPEWRPPALELADEETAALRQRAVWLRDVVRAEHAASVRRRTQAAPWPTLPALPALLTSGPAWLAARVRHVRTHVRARFERFGPRDEHHGGRLPVLSAEPSPG